jgi:hypothetical protein
MQKNPQTVLLALLLSSILLIAASRVNDPSTRPVAKPGAFLADGVPLPPPPQKKPNGIIVVADGIPMPPPIPVKKPNYGA